MDNTFEQIRLAREAPGANQDRLAPMEHRAFTRQWVQENPFVAIPSLTAAIPLYTAAKALGLAQTRSKPSLYQMGQGYAGIWDGLKALSR